MRLFYREVKARANATDAYQVSRLLPRARFGTP